MAQPFPEKRGTRRFSLRLPVAVKAQKGEVPAFTRDISSHGICFLIDMPLVVGSELQFTLTLPSEMTLTGTVRVRCYARVVRIEEAPKASGKAVAAIIKRYEFLGDRR